MAVMSMFFGQFMISLILIAMSISAEFTLEERRAFKDFKDTEYFHKRSVLASHIISVYTLMSFCKLQVKRDAQKNNIEEDEIIEDEQESDREQAQKIDRDMPSKREIMIKKTSNILKGDGKVFKFTRFLNIGNLRAYQRLKIQYNTIVREFKQLNS